MVSELIQDEDMETQESINQSKVRLKHKIIFVLRRLAFQAI